MPIVRLAFVQTWQYCHCLEPRPDLLSVLNSIRLVLPVLPADNEACVLFRGCILNTHALHTHTCTSRSRCLQLQRLRWASDAWRWQAHAVPMSSSPLRVNKTRSYMNVKRNEHVRTLEPGQTHDSIRCQSALCHLTVFVFGCGLATAHVRCARGACAREMPLRSRPGERAGARHEHRHIAAYAAFVHLPAAAFNPRGEQQRLPRELARAHEPTSSKITCLESVLNINAVWLVARQGFELRTTPGGDNYFVNMLTGETVLARDCNCNPGQY